MTAASAILRRLLTLPIRRASQKSQIVSAAKPNADPQPPFEQFTPELEPRRWAAAKYASGSCISVVLLILFLPHARAVLPPVQIDLSWAKVTFFRLMPAAAQTTQPEGRVAELPPPTPQDPPETKQAPPVSQPTIRRTREPRPPDLLPEQAVSAPSIVAQLPQPRPQPETKQVPPVNQAPPIRRTREPRPPDLLDEQPVLVRAPAPAAPPISEPINVPSTENAGNTLRADSTIPVLNLAQKEDAVRVQQRLIELKFLDGAANGIWGARSRNALSAFRAAKGLGNNDTWDDVTQRQLFDDLPAQAPTNVTFVGGWAKHAGQCGRSSGSPSVRITSDHAESSAGRCDFDSVHQQAEGSWIIRAHCSVAGSRWPANITLTRAGSHLIWKSEKGVSNYYACSS